MELFVIGNGFDIAHKLNTRYTDFRNYIEDKSWSFLVRFEELYGLYPGSDKKAVEDYLWNDFENNLSGIIEETLVDNGASIELDLESGDIGISDTLDTYWEQEYGFIEELHNYLYEWVAHINIDVEKKTKLIENYHDDLYLTFNYTLMLENLYEIDPHKILHIHGSLNKFDDRPIIGHGNYEKISRVKELAEDAANHFYEKEESIYRAMSNYYTRTMKDVETLISINQPFFRKLFQVRQIHVIGTSFGEVDMPYFRKIKENTRNDVIWNIYYYDPKDINVFIEKIQSLGINKENILSLNSSEFFDRGV